MSIVIYPYPGACSRVTMDALETIGLDYEDRCVNIAKTAQKAPDYLALNPKGKVPTMVFEGTTMTENAAMLHFLDQRYPAAGLLPRTGDPLVDIRGLIDLVWCSSTIHPIVRQCRMPMKWTKGDPAGVHEDGLEKMAQEAAGMAARIGEGWWYGDAWSIIDTYVYWAYSTAEKGGFPVKDFPVLVGHAARVRSRPSFQRVLAREAAMVAQHGIADTVL